ncbi:hypothetical protein, conserved in T. vivax, (fragment), partial [Trypanosoma vivax Y486]
MVSKCFCLLLLFTLLLRDATASALRCSKKRPLPREEGCPTKDVLLGWMNVVNKPAMRAEALMKNASEIVRHARNMRSKAEKLNKEYQIFRASLNSADNKNDFELISQAITDVNDTIAKTNEFELKANEAYSAAKGSLNSTTVYFDAVMRVAYFVWNADPNGVWNYTSVKEKLDQYGEDCEKEYNISKVLSKYAENMESMSLTDWKHKTLQLLQETYNNLMMNKCKYDGIITNNDEKLQVVKNTVKGAVERLEISVKELELLQTAVNNADKKMEDASRSATAANDSVLASANGKVFCEIVEQFWKSDGELKAVEKTVVDAKQKVVDMATSSDQVRAKVTIMDKVVKDTVLRLQRGSSTFVRTFSIANNLDGVASSATKASAAANASVRTATEANTIVNEVQQKVKTQASCWSVFGQSWRKWVTQQATKSVMQHSRCA